MTFRMTYDCNCSYPFIALNLPKAHRLQESCLRQMQAMTSLLRHKNQWTAMSISKLMVPDWQTYPLKKENQYWLAPAFLLPFVLPVMAPVVKDLTLQEPTIWRLRLW